ncbi:MAG: hypothetical protein RQ899_13420 [Pseudomonadales bacterium]|nr:hypothetical protein [Pseudomonadales bacterium]
MKNSAILACIPIISVLVACSEAEVESVPCTTDRECLIQVADDYLKALVAHSPQSLSLAEDFRFIENLERKNPGEGLWQTASALPGDFRIYVPDTLSRQVGFIGVMEENGKPIELALRLYVVDGQIQAAEHLIARNLREAGLTNLQSPRPGLLSTIPEAERMPRSELLTIGYSYYDALNLNDGSLAPFADDCVRRENGLQTSSNPVPANGAGEFSVFGTLGCAEQLDTGTMSYIDAIDNRRVNIADPETGLVFGLSHFRHSMTNKTIAIKGVPGITSREVNFDPFDLPAAHIFKISEGMIHEIEAMGFQAPYDSPTGWEGGYRRPQAGNF